MKGSAILLFFILSVFISCIYAYKVVGNKLYDPTGDEVIIKGIDRPSMEWNTNGEGLSLADYTLMKAWGANCVRVSLNQDFWLSDASYKTRVVQQATWINSLGMGVIYDLHWNNGGQQNMADRNSITFWSQMATTFKNNPWVMFELYNEPHDVSWQVWRDGGGNYAGMQEMYNSVRAAGSNNVVIVCGLNWAYDLSGVVNYALDGHNISYASHPYNFAGKKPGDWEYGFGYLVDQYPVMLTEFGQYCANDNYVAELLAYAELKKIHWTAWAWYVQGCGFPSIIADWNGNPFGVVGEIVYSYLGGTNLPPVTTTGTTGPIPPATQPLVIYSDSLQNGFEDWSWAEDRNLADTTHFAVKDHGGLYFNLPTNLYFTLGSYSKLQFYIYSTVYQSADKIVLILYDGNKAEVGNKIDIPTAVQANTWTLVSVPVTSFGVTLGLRVSGVAIQADVANNLGYVWIDDISFVPAESATVTTAASATSTGKVTTSAATTSKGTTSSTTAKATTASTATTSKGTTSSTTAKATTGSATTSKGTTSSTTAKATTGSATTAKATTASSTTAKATTASTATTAKATTGSTTTSKGTTSSTTAKVSTSSTSSTGTATSGSSACSASSITVSQVAQNSWPQGGQTITQYTVTISSTCSRPLVGLTLSLSNWNPFGFWGGSVTGDTFTLPSYVQVTTSSPFSFGYQNYGGQAGFTVATVTFQ